MPLYKSISIDLVEVEVIQHIFNQISDQSHKKWEYTSWSCPHHVNGMSAELRDSGLLNMINNLSSKDKTCLIRYIHGMEDADQKLFEDISDDTQPYTMEELNARIDEAEVEIENGGGKSFKEMMDGFKQELLFR